MMMDAEGAALEVPAGRPAFVAFWTVGAGRAATLAEGGGAVALACGGTSAVATETAAEGPLRAGAVTALRRDPDTATPTTIAPASKRTPPPAATYGTHFDFGLRRTRAMRSEPVIGPSVSASGRSARGPDFRSDVMRDKLEKLGWLGGTLMPTRRWMRSTCERACIGAKSERSVASSATFW